MTSFGLLGVPFDGAATLGWPGSRYAPEAVRRHLTWMTQRIEEQTIFWVDRERIVSLPELRDLGDVDVVPHDVTATLAAVRGAVAGACGDGLVPLVVGGDDSILFATVAGVHDAHDGDIGVAHFDAHLDLLAESALQGRFSHSSGMRRALELDRVRPEMSVQIGVRNFNFPAARRWAQAAGLAQIPARRVHEDPAGATAAARRQSAEAAHLVVAIDMDVVDPAHAPGVGWHEPGGLTSHQMLEMVEAFGPEATAVCLTEVNPLTDHREQTSILAANLLFHLIAATESG